MLITYYTVECDAGLLGDYQRARDCQTTIRELRSTSKEARADARRLKWWRQPARPSANRKAAVDLCPPCAILNGKV